MSCSIASEVQPRGCVHNASWQEWEPVVNEQEYKVRYPIAFHTVDVAVVKTDHDHDITHVLLIQKPHEVERGVWRFCGGFIDPTDDSAEDAGGREVMEETGMDVYELHYIGSANIDDHRYRDTPHGIITSFFFAEHKSGEAGKGFDDVAVTKWFAIEEIFSSEFKENPTHKPLFEMFRELVNSGRLVLGKSELTIK